MEKKPQSMMCSFLQRLDKERLLGQKALVVWFTGLSGSGKTTIAIDLERRLHELGFKTQVFDADFIRTTINRDLDFTMEGRIENIRRMAAISRLFVEAGLVVICCFISPTRRIRQMARTIIGANDYCEVFVNAPFEVCEARDPKGLYVKARRGEISDFTGIDSPYEAPEHPDLEIRTDQCNVTEAVNQVLDFFLPKIVFKE
ncbi:MAG: adenylyl-sulfate kinase [Bacteroidales bacterium]|jgi:adenylyl-sulfate kinase|nr:adenylyl-sulfate kinase [Bacteroidales bacterium]NLM92974.1 adenylyl-sulfate kinase [Bacteroidales bacterium]